jgi:hypothetical protein
MRKADAVYVVLHGGFGEDGGRCRRRWPRLARFPAPLDARDDGDEVEDEADSTAVSPELGDTGIDGGGAVLSAGVSASDVRERKRRGKKRWRG